MKIRRNKAWAESVCRRFGLDIGFAKVLLAAIARAKANGIPFSTALQQSFVKIRVIRV
jgi:antitoxin component of RelBE/YafQ-DinJ toxin-antitoxin module